MREAPLPKSRAVKDVKDLIAIPQSYARAPRVQCNTMMMILENN